MASDFEKQAQEIVTDDLDDGVFYCSLHGYYNCRQCKELRARVSAALSSAASAARAQAVNEAADIAVKRFSVSAALTKYCAEIRALAPTPPAAAQLPPEVEKALLELEATCRDTRCEAPYLARAMALKRLDELRAKDDRGRT